jgi:hypothetical protein
MIRFRQYYQEFYQSRTFLVTPADEPRRAIRAYRDYRRYVGLPRQGMDSPEAEQLDQQTGYHLGAYELAEIVGDARLAEAQWEAFLCAWSSYLYTLRVSDTQHSEASGPGWWNELLAGLRFIGKRFECSVADIRTGPTLRCRQVIDRVEEVCCLREIRCDIDGTAPIEVRHTGRPRADGSAPMRGPSV